MKHAAIHRAFVARFSPTDGVLGSWLRLQLHASDLESGIGVERATRYRRIGVARIPAAKAWDKDTWLRATGTTPEAVVNVVDAGLARWRGQDLIVEGYDLFAQKRATENLRRLVEGGFVGVNNPPRHPPRNPAIAGSTSGAPLGAPVAPLLGATSHPIPSDPDLPPAGRSQSALPSPKGGAGGGERPGRVGQRAPHGAGDPGTGPEGFERWWPEFCSIRPCKPWWKPLVLEQWVAEDLEGEADEIRAFTRWKAKHGWRQQPGPEGQSMIPTPRILLARGGWRKPGPWNTPAAAPAPPPRSRSRETQPEVVDLQQVGVNVTIPHRHLMEFLADIDVSEEDKIREKRRWIETHPGELPPWARQPDQQPNGRTQ
jgi:hypothetical protein